MSTGDLGSAAFTELWEELKILWQWVLSKAKNNYLILSSWWWTAVGSAPRSLSGGHMISRLIKVFSKQPVFNILLVVPQ